MKRILSLCISLVLLISAVMPVSAADQGELILHRKTVLDCGIECVEEVTVYSNTRATQKRAEIKRTFTRDNTTIAIIAYEAVFQYDGSTVSVVSKSITQVDTYDGWSFKQNSFTSSGGTVTLTGKLSKLLILNTSVNLTLTCDKSGNIS